MGKWDIYEEKPDRSDKWTKYEEIKELPGQIQEDSWPTLIGKSAAKGLTDIPKGILGATEAVANFQRKYPTPLHWFKGSRDIEPYNISEKFNNVTDDILGESIKPMTGDSDLKKIVGTGVEFAAGSSPFGAIGKGASLIKRFKAAKDAALLGANAGVISGGLQAGGTDPLISDIVGTIAPTPLGLTKGTLGVARKFAGLAPDKIKLDTAKAYNDLGINVTAPIISNSNAPAFYETLVGKAPITGSKLAKEYKLIDDQIKGALDNTLDRLSPKRTPEIENKIAADYNKIEAGLSNKDKIVPTHLLEVLDSVDIKSASNSPSEKAVLKVIADLRKSFDIRYNKDVKKMFPGETPNIALEAIPVKELWKAKKSLNSIIKDKDFKDVRNLLKNIRGGLQKDIDAFGITNPEWGNLYKQTEDTYARLKGRDTLQDMLINQPTNFGSETFSYNKLANNIKDPEAARKLTLAVKNDPELLERIEKLGKVASSYGNKIARNPNPSGTAGTEKIISYIASALGAGYVGVPTYAMATGGGAGLLLTVGLTNKSFLDSAIKYASQPTISTGMKFGKAVKRITGKPLTTIARELDR